MKKANYLSAVALRTPTSEPIFTYKRSGWNYYVTTNRPNDNYSTIHREGNNGVWLQQIRFTKEASGVGVTLVGSAQLYRLNQIEIFEIGYEQAWNKIEANAEANRIAILQRTKDEDAARAQRKRDASLVDELLPIVKDLLASTGVRVTDGYSDVTITVKASQLEGFIELLTHSVSE